MMSGNLNFDIGNHTNLRMKFMISSGNFLKICNKPIQYLCNMAVFSPY